MNRWFLKIKGSTKVLSFALMPIIPAAIYTVSVYWPREAPFSFFVAITVWVSLATGFKDVCVLLLNF